MKKANRVLTVLIFAFLYLPMLVLVVASFNTGKDLTIFESFTLDQYKALFQDKDLLALITYIAEEDKLQKILENPQVIKIPVVRNGKQSTLGYMPEVWKGWK